MFISSIGKLFMKKIYLALLGAIILISCDLSKYRLVKEYDFETVIECSNRHVTATYGRIIRYYSQLTVAHTRLRIEDLKLTVSGQPMHIVTYSPEEVYLL